MSGRPKGESAVHQIQILEHLRKNDLTQKQLSELTDLNVSTISKHLRTLEQNGFISKYKTNIIYYKIDFTNFNISYFDQIRSDVVDYSVHRINQMCENVKTSRRKTKKVLDGVIDQIEDYRNYLFYHADEFSQFSKYESREDLLKYARELQDIRNKLVGIKSIDRDYYQVRKKRNLRRELKRYVDNLLDNVQDSILTVPEKTKYAIKIRKILDTLES